MLKVLVMYFSYIMRGLSQPISTGRNLLSSLCVEHSQTGLGLNMSEQAEQKLALRDVPSSTNL